MKFYINVIYFILLVVMSTVLYIGSWFGRIRLFIRDGEMWSVNRAMADFIDNLLEE